MRISRPSSRRGNSPLGCANSTPKGYFPVSALKSRAQRLPRVHAGHPQLARARAVQPAYIDRLLDTPGQNFTRIQGFKLWHAALREYCLQTHLDA